MIAALLGKLAGAGVRAQAAHAARQLERAPGRRCIRAPVVQGRGLSQASEEPGRVALLRLGARIPALSEVTCRTRGPGAGRSSRARHTRGPGFNPSASTQGKQNPITSPNKKCSEHVNY